MSKKTVLGLVGPTASGKTALSIELARKLGGEILCMDSMQIYRGMDIGTAKPTPEEQSRVPHHLIDLVSPEEPFTVADYRAHAVPLLDSVPVPVLAGGTGLYLRALSLPMELGHTVGDPEVRAGYQRFAEENGNPALHALLRQRDPETAARLHPNDLRRVIRALEVLDLTGRPLSAQRLPGYEASPYRFVLFALDWPRDVLYARIERRVDEMMRAGLPDEVARLFKAGVPADSQAIQGLGYKELYACMRGECSLQDAAALIKQRTRHYAKRQLTWFRADPRVNWLPADEGHFPSVRDIETMLEEQTLER